MVICIENVVYQNVYFQANKSGTLIHKIETDDNDVKDQIEMFSLQIAHKRVEFSAGGLFPIDYTLLFSVSKIFFL